MSFSKCDMHKLGPFVVKENSASRSCFCCGYRSNYPLSQEIMDAVKKQKYANKMFDKFINEYSYDSGNDIFIVLISIIFDYLSYLYINQESIDRFMKKIKECNIYFNGDDKDSSRFSLINDSLSYFDCFFKKKALEIKGGIVDDQINENLDSMSEQLSVRFDLDLSRIYDLREKGPISSKK